MFKVCGIIGISEIEILNFSSTERAKRNNVQTSHIFLLPKLPYLNHIEKYVKIKDLFNIIIPSEDTKLSELNQYQKSDEAGFIIYADLECLIEKIDGLQNNRENSSTTKVAEHILSGFSMSAIPQLKNRK